MNKKTYREIESVTMADSENIEYITFAGLPEEIDDSDIIKTKQEVFEVSYFARVKGYGKHSGKCLGTLPEALKNKISKMLSKIAVNL